MAYNFAMITAASSMNMTPVRSQVNNSYIDYTIQAPVSTEVTDDQYWVTNYTPKLTDEGAVTAPMRIYSPYLSRFLGSTEQIYQIADITGSQGQLAGTLSFVSPQNALSWVFKLISASQYSIYVDDPAITDKTQLKYRLVYDAQNNNRVMITDAVIQRGGFLEDQWKLKGWI